MSVKTNRLYWDCGCQKNYIHKKSKGNYCPRCQTFLSCHQADSHSSEIKEMYDPKKDCAIFKDEILTATTFQLRHGERNTIGAPVKFTFELGDSVELEWMGEYGTIIALDELGNCKIKMDRVK